MPITDEVELRRIIETARTIAIVGASATPGKDAHEIPRYLQAVGYRIIPVNPNADRVLGLPTVPRLELVRERVDIVDVFRPAVEAPVIARAAAAIGAKVLWLQEGIVSAAAARIAEAAGLEVVMDRCLGALHQAFGVRPLNDRKVDLSR